jgi:hypothetical protein
MSRFDYLQQLTKGWIKPPFEHARPECGVAGN